MHVFNRKKRKASAHSKRQARLSGWASVGMQLTFRAEVMPGRESSQRTFTVTRVMASGRVELKGLFGQHAQTAFEPIR
jgi:hypothetical protein